MPAPMKSLRPKKRPNRRLGPDDEGSTQHPSGKNMDQRTQGSGAGTRHPSGKNIYEQDTQMFEDGGRVKPKKKLQTLMDATDYSAKKEKKTMSAQHRRDEQFFKDVKKVDGKSRVSKSELIEKHGDDSQNLTRYGTGAQAGRSFGQKTRGDAKKYMGGGMVKQGYMDGGEVVRRGDVRDNPKRGKCY